MLNFDAKNGVKGGAGKSGASRKSEVLEGGEALI